MSAVSSVAPSQVAPPDPPRRPRANRELYIDVFRGLMALVMVQGHVFDTLLNPAARAEPWYMFQQVFHGSTAPGFLFASGFVAGLPRAPLSWRAMRCTRSPSASCSSCSSSACSAGAGCGPRA